jgi:glycosyltransferase involved in cell wall biosynthesis
MAKRCLIVTYYFPPTGGGGVQRNAKLIKYLSRKDWKFSVVTSDGHSANIASDESLQADVPSDVEIIPVSFLNNGKNKFLSSIKSTFFIRFISSFLFIPDRHKKWVQAAKKSIIETLAQKSYDLVLISSPPYSLAQMAAELTEELSIPVVLDMRDPWTTNPYKIYPTSWHKKQDQKCERKSIKKIKYGISAYQSLVNFYSTSIAGFDKNNWRTIPNGFDEEDFKNIIPQNLESNKFHIAFSGTFYSHLNNPKFLFQAIAGLGKEEREKIRFHHIGSSAQNLKKIAARHGLQNNLVEWGYQNHKKCLEILSGMDAFCFILDSTNKNADKTIGGKVYEYLRLGKPILALVPHSGEAADCVNKTESGIVIDPSDTQRVLKLLQTWITSPPKIRTNRKIIGFYRERLAEQYASFFDEIINKF